MLLLNYAEKLAECIKSKYIEKSLLIHIDPLLASAQSEECLPPVKCMDLLTYLIQSLIVNVQFKAFQSLQAYNQMVSGFMSSCTGSVDYSRSEWTIHLCKNETIQVMSSAWPISGNFGQPFETFLRKWPTSKNIIQISEAKNNHNHHSKRLFHCVHVQLGGSNMLVTEVTGSR